MAYPGHNSATLVLICVCKMDLKNRYLSVHLPAKIVNRIRVPAGTGPCAIAIVLFGWHQAPGLVGHLIDRVLSSLPPTTVVITQYLDDILFVRPHAIGPNPQEWAGRSDALCGRMHG